MFEDPSYTKLNTIVLSTSTLGAKSVLIGGFAPINPDSYGLGYSVFDDMIGQFMNDVMLELVILINLLLYT